MVTKVESVLETKKLHEIVSVKPETTVIEALEIMANYGVGAILVMDGPLLKGIFSERDYARKGIIKGRKAKSTTMSEVMTANVITVGIKDTTKECMELMDAKGIRHLPVVDADHNVVGVLSIRDIVNSLIKEQRQHINFLENYISGSVAG